MPGRAGPGRAGSDGDRVWWVPPLDGQTLLVVREDPGEVVPVRIDANLLSGRLRAPFGTGQLRFPTTAAIREDRVLVVNSQLDRAPDRGQPPFRISALKRPR